MKWKHLIWSLFFLLLFGAAAQLPAQPVPEQRTEVSRKLRAAGIPSNTLALAEKGDADGQYFLGVCYH